MRKLSAAGMLAAGVLGLALQANAASVAYTIDGSLSAVENSCTQINYLLGGGDCSYGGNRPNPSGVYIGPVQGAAYYPVGSAGDSLTPSGSPVAPVLTGTITIDDSGTIAGPDDTISGQLIVGETARATATGQSTRAVERWDTLTLDFGATTVTSATANGNGGFDYVIGSKGFPQLIAAFGNPTDLYPSPNAPGGLGSETCLEGPPVQCFWVGPEPSGIGFEASTVLNGPAGNIGIAPSSSFTGYSCNDQNASDCSASPILFGPAGTAAWTNVVIKVSTDDQGQITAASAFWDKEYRITFGGPPPGNNSWAAGLLTFTGSSKPVANDDTVEVVENSTNNAIDVLANDGDFGPSAAVTILSGPANGTANVVDNEVIYTPTASYTGADEIVYQVTDGGENTDSATVFITVRADITPVTPAGSINISTAGVQPNNALGSVNLTSLPTFDAGNPPSNITATAGTKGATAVTGTTITYTPAADFFAGSDTFDYTVTDAQGDSSTGTITVTIPEVDPAITGGNITTEQDTASSPLALTVTPGNGSGAQHTLAVTTPATNGTCTLSGTTAAAAVSVTYTPNADFFGTDSCVVTITDGNGDTGTGTINVTVEEVSNDIKLPGGGSAVDVFSLAILAGLPLLRRRRSVR